MQLKTKARDCLYVNWAVPRDAAPELPASLRYELHDWRDEPWVFASALLFRFSGLHNPGAPLLRLSYPQMNLRLYVLDAEDVPSVLFLRVMVPFWVAPVSRLVGRQPATAGRFSYPSPSDNGGDAWTWSLRRDRRLELTARLASPTVGPGPSLGSWQRTVDYVRRRPRGYVSWEGKVRSITKSHPSVAVWPLEVEVTDSGLLAETFAGVDAGHWRRPHSAWLCPEIPFTFEVGKPELLPLAAPRRIAAVPDGC